jgi:Flp pilus assembly protein TadB
MSENPLGTLVLALPASAAAVATPAVVMAGNPLLVGFAAVIPAAAALGSSAGARSRERFHKMSVKLINGTMRRENPYDLAERIGRSLYGALAATVAFLALLLAAVLTHSFHPLLLAAAPLTAITPIIVLFPYLSSGSERKGLLTVEYPFFTVMASIVSYCGTTLYTAFQQVKKVPAVFKQVSKEANEVERKAVLAGVGVIRGIEAHAETHPHEQFGRMLLTATSVWRSGGNVIATLEELASESIRWLVDRFDRFAQNVATASEVMFTVLILTPMGVALTTIPGIQQSTTSMLALMVMLPILGMVISFAVYSAMPKIPNAFTISMSRIALTVAVAVASAAATYMVIQIAGVDIPFVVIAAVIATAFGAVTHITVKLQVSEIEDTERELKRFLRIAVEERKIGKPMFQALKTAASQPYRPGMRGLMKAFKARLNMGLSIYQAGATARSWLARAVFYLVDTVDRFGGASPELLEKVISLLSSYTLSRDSVKAKTRLFLYITYSTPFIMALMLGMVYPLISGTAFQDLGGLNLELGQAGEMFKPNPEAGKAMIDQGMTMMLLASLIQVFTISYAMDMHPWGMKRLAIAAALYIPAYYMTPYMGELFKNTFFTGAK